jgi:hypothetical protein
MASPEIFNPEFMSSPQIVNPEFKKYVCHFLPENILEIVKGSL